MKKTREFRELRSVKKVGCEDNHYFTPTMERTVKVAWVWRRTIITNESIESFVKVKISVHSLYIINEIK